MRERDDEPIHRSEMMQSKMNEVISNLNENKKNLEQYKKVLRYKGINTDNDVLELDLI